MELEIAPTRFFAAHEDTIENSVRLCEAFFTATVPGRGQLDAEYMANRIGPDKGNALVAVRMSAGRFMFRVETRNLDEFRIGVDVLFIS